MDRSYQLYTRPAAEGLVLAARVEGEPPPEGENWDAISIETALIDRGFGWNDILLAVKKADALKGSTPTSGNRGPIRTGEFVGPAETRRQRLKKANADVADIGRAIASEGKPEAFPLLMAHLALRIALLKLPPGPLMTEKRSVEELMDKLEETALRVRSRYLPHTVDVTGPGFRSERMTLDEMHAEVETAARNGW